MSTHSLLPVPLFLCTTCPGWGDRGARAAPGGGGGRGRGGSGGTRRGGAGGGSGAASVACTLQ